MSPPKRKRLFGVADNAPDPLDDLPERNPYGDPVRVDIGEAQIHDAETAAEDAAANDEQDGPPAPPFDFAVDPKHPYRALALAARQDNYNGGRDAPPAGDTLPVARLPPKPSAEPLPGAEYTRDLPEQSPFEPAAPDAAPPQETAREIPQVTAPTFRHDASSAAASNPDKNGKNPDVMGIDTDVGNSVDDLHKRTAAAYAAMYGADGPKMDESPRAQAYQPTPVEGHRQTDEDMRRVWAINTIFGHEGDNFKAVNMLQDMNSAYDQRQAQHDQAQMRAWAAQQKGAVDTRPITMAQAQQGVTAGWFSPEAIGHMTQGDFAAMAKANVGSLRSREEATQMKGNVAAQSQLGQNYRDDKKNVITAERANQDAAVRLENGRANERLWDKKFGNVKSPERQKALVGIISSATQIPDASVHRYLETGSTEGLSDEQAQNLRNVSDSASLIVTPEALQKAGGQTVNREATRIAAPGLGAAKTLASPEFVHKITQPVENVRAALDPAYRAVSRLANATVEFEGVRRPALEVLAKTGTSGWSKVLGQISGDKQVHDDMARVYKFFQKENHESFGANFTPTEQGLASASSGVHFGAGIDPGADPSVIVAHMNDAMKAYQAMRERAQRELSGKGGL